MGNPVGGFQVRIDPMYPLAAPLSELHGQNEGRLHARFARAAPHGSHLASARADCGLRRRSAAAGATVVLFAVATGKYREC